MSSNDTTSSRDLRAILHELAQSGAAGMICRFPTHPLDTCKTVAFSNDVESTSVIKVGKKIWAREGFAGFYRGVGITSLAAFPGNALYFVSYEWSRDTVAACQLSFPKPLVHLGCGFFAEAVSCCVWVPVDVVKERLQSQGPDIVGRYRNGWHGFVTCYKAERLRGLYKGYFSTLASFGPFSAVYFASFEMFNKWLTPLGFNAFGQGLLAALAGNTMSAIVTNPLELVKTRLQIQAPMLENAGAYRYVPIHGYQYTSFVGGLRAVHQLHGVKGLWRGAMTRAIHTGPNAALTMGVYQWLKRTYPYEM